MSAWTTYRLSAQQRAHWCRCNSMRVGVCSLSSESPINLDSVSAAFAHAAARHDILRLTLQRVPGQQLPMMSFAPQGSRRQLMDSLWPTGEPPSGECRPQIVRSPDGYRLDVSFPVLLADRYTLLHLSAALTGVAPAHDSSDAPPSYLAFAAWQDEVLEQMTAEERDYWRSRRVELDESPRALVGGQGNAPAVQPQSIAWRSLDVPLTSATADSLRRAAARLGCSVKELLLATWAFLIGQNRDRQTVSLGVTADGRSFSSFEQLWGPVERTLPLTVSVRPTLAQMLPAVRQALDEQLEREVSFDWVLDGQDRFAVAYGFTRVPPMPLGWHVERVHYPDDTASLFCSVLDAGVTLQLKLDYDPAIYEGALLASLARQLSALLIAVAADPLSELPPRVLHDQDRERVLRGFNDTSRPRPEQGAAALFYAQARRRPDHEAIVDATMSISYGELAAWASRIAAEINACGAERVGVLLQPSAAMVAAMLGALTAGKPFVPLDPSSPPGLTAAILADKRLAIVLTETAQAYRVTTAKPLIVSHLRLSSETPPPPELPGAAAVAYMIYTSGTTGRPKAVAVSNGALVNYVGWLAEALDVGSEDRSALLTSAAYDLGYTALWGTLLTGGTLFVPPSELIAEPRRLLAALVRQRVSFLKLTPSLLRLLLEHGTALFPVASLRMLVLGGESIRPADLLEVSRAIPKLVIVNHYGPTEATIGCIAWRIAPGMLADFCQAPVLGRPIANNRIYVLDPQRRPVSPGVMGEIWVGGRGLSEGYPDDVQLTSERFIHIEELGRIYRTGDLGSWDPEGRVVFHGRADGQIKLRGVRVELGGIERVLAEHPGLEDAAVIAVPKPDGPPEVLALCVPSSARAAPVRGLCRLVQEVPRAASKWWELPGGEPFVGLHTAETLATYREIIERRCYLGADSAIVPGDVVVDVGANVGLFALQAALEAPGVRVIAIEPAPEAFACLEANSRIYGDGRWSCRQLALGATRGEATLTVYRDHSLLATLYPEAEQDRALLQRMAEQRGGGRLDDSVRAGIWGTIGEQLSASESVCQLWTLSDLIRTEGLDRIDWLKIDVQRAEWDVLTGIEAAHWQLVHNIMVEVHDGDHRLDKVAELLSRHGFVFAVCQDPAHVGSDRHLVRATREGAGGTRQKTRLSPTQSWRSPSALVQAVRLHCKNLLPEPAVPTRVVLVDRLPLTANAKRSSHALLATLSAGVEIAERLTGPPSARGKRLAALWSELLEVEAVGLESDFFRLGGHSLIAARLTMKLRDELAIELTLAEVLRHSRFGDLLALLDARMDGVPPSLALVPRAPGGDSYPLSHLQLRLWLLAQFPGGNQAYNLSRAFRLQGAVCAELLQRAGEELVRRHDALRTVVLPRENKQRTQAEEKCQLRLTTETLGQWDEAQACEIARRESKRPFDLSTDLLFRLHLAYFDDRQHLLVLSTHHIIADGWSLEILMEELFVAYSRLREGALAFAEPLPRVHADFVHALIASAERAVPRAVDYLEQWRQVSLQEVALPLDAPRPKQPTFAGRSIRCRGSSQLMGQLRALSRTLRVSTFCLCVAGLDAVLRHWAKGTPEQDVLLAVTVSGRDLPGVHQQVGFFANTVLLRESGGGAVTCVELIERCNTGLLESLEHRHLPLTEVVGRIRAPRHAHGMSSIPSVGITWYEIDAEARPESHAAAAGLECSMLPLEEHGARTDLWFFVRPGETLDWQIIYDEALFRTQTIEALGRNLLAALAQLVERPSTPITELRLENPAPPWSTAEMNFAFRL